MVKKQMMNWTIAPALSLAIFILFCTQRVVCAWRWQVMFYDLYKNYSPYFRSILRYFYYNYSLVGLSLSCVNACNSLIVKRSCKCFLQSKQLSNNLIGNVLHMSQLVSKSWLYITLPLGVCKRLWKENCCIGK